MASTFFSLDGTWSWAAGGANKGEFVFSEKSHKITISCSVAIFLTESTRHLEAVHFLWVAVRTFFETRKWKKDSAKKTRNDFVGQKGKNKMTSSDKMKMSDKSVPRWKRQTRPAHALKSGSAMASGPSTTLLSEPRACFLTLEPKSSGIFLTHPLAVRSGS